MSDVIQAPPSLRLAIRQRPDGIVIFRDGARMLRYLPRGAIEQTVVLFGRTSFAADDPFLVRLIDHFKDHAIALDIFEAPLERTFGIVSRHSFLRRLPSVFQYAVKALLVAAKPHLWKCVPPRLQGDAAYAKSRADSFLAAQHQMQPKPSIAFGRSGGAIAITRHAQSLDLKALICLGYPFRHPDQGDEPARYAHLATLTTPCLIIQGERDPYGDSVSAPQYALSPATSLRFVDSDHETSFPEDVLQNILDQVVGFIRAH